jgi:hypothetical protein
MPTYTQPFLALTTTIPRTVGGVAGATTMTFTPSADGYPSVRIVNAGTANAFIQFITTDNATTVAVTNSQPVLASQSVVLATGGFLAMGMNTSSTFTTTIFVTAGQGGTAV